MKTLTRRIILIGVSIAWLLALFVPMQTVKADIGPKPSMTFIFKIPDPSIKILEGRLFTCEDEECLTPRESEIPVYCDENRCNLYRNSSYHESATVYQLTVKFTDGVRASNIFSQSHYIAIYDVDIRGDELFVKERAFESFLKSTFTGFSLFLFLLAYVATVVIELLVALIFLLISKKKKAMLGYILLVNLISLSIVWFVLPNFIQQNVAFIVVSECFAFASEATLLVLFGKKYDLKIWQAILLSFLMNAASFMAGNLMLGGL